MPRIGAVVAIVALGCVVSGCGGHARSNRVGGKVPVHVRVLLMADGGTDPEELQAFAKRAHDLSGGSLRVKLHSSWRAGQANWETGLIHDVQARKADLGWAAPRAWDTVGVPSFRALNAPLLIDSYALQDKVLRSPVVSRMLDGLKPLGLNGLGVLPGQMRRPFGLRRQFVKPSDFAGTTLGTQESNVADQTLRALGARSVRLPITQVRDLGGLDGLEQRVSTVYAWYSRHGGYYSANVNLWPRPIVLFANAKLFASLTDAQRRALREAATAQIGGQTAAVRAGDREAAADLCRAGSVRFVRASAGELAALRQAVQPAYDWLERDSATARAIAAIEQLKGGSPPAVSNGLPGCSRADGASAKATPVDGTWTLVTARSDAAPDFLAENWGKWVYVFDRGRFADTQENAKACTWGYGTYVVKGNKVEWTFKDGGGVAPNGAYNKPGEFFVFGWSRYHDTLTLTPVKGKVSPGNFRAKTWRLVSKAPLPDRFSRRCPPPKPALTR